MTNTTDKKTSASTHKKVAVQWLNEASFTATSLAEDVAFNEVAILNATSLTGDVAKKER